MKRILVWAACALFCVAACIPTEMTSEADNGILVVSLSGAGDPLTKAGTAVMGNDAKLHHVEVFIFKTDGTLYRRDTLAENVTSRSLEGIKAGYYYLAAVANGPDLSSVQTRTNLEQAAITLSMNNPAQGFLMYGAPSGMVTVNSGAATSVSIPLTRHVSRVCLTTVENRLPSDYGTLRVECAFLENVVGDWNIAGSGNPSGYLNQAGRKAGKSTSTTAADMISTAADAECAALTFSTVGSTVARGTVSDTLNKALYTFPNRLAASNDHFAGTTGNVCARLVLLVTYGSSGDRWYYPVTIPAMERNKSYDVSFVISGPGSSDPNQKVMNGSMNATVSVKKWVAGTSFSGDF